MAVKYHVNGKGDVNPCFAQVKACQFGDERHFGSKQEAVAFYEKSMESNVVPLPMAREKGRVLDFTEEDFQLAMGALSQVFKLDEKDQQLVGSILRGNKPDKLELDQFLLRNSQLDTQAKTSRSFEAASVLMAYLEALSVRLNQ